MQEAGTPTRRVPTQNTLAITAAPRPDLVVPPPPLPLSYTTPPRGHSQAEGKFVFRGRLVITSPKVYTQAGGKSVFVADWSLHHPKFTHRLGVSLCSSQTVHHTTQSLYTGCIAASMRSDQITSFELRKGGASFLGGPPLSCDTNHDAPPHIHRRTHTSHTHAHAHTHTHIHTHAHTHHTHITHTSHTHSSHQPSALHHPLQEPTHIYTHTSHAVPHTHTHTHSSHTQAPSALCSPHTLQEPTKHIRMHLTCSSSHTRRRSHTHTHTHTTYTHTTQALPALCCPPPPTRTPCMTPPGTNTHVTLKIPHMILLLRLPTVPLPSSHHLPLFPPLLRSKQPQKPVPPHQPQYLLTHSPTIPPFPPLLRSKQPQP